MLRPVRLTPTRAAMASKTRALLYAMAGRGRLRRYVPFDVSETVVRECMDLLADPFPGTELHGVIVRGYGLYYDVAIDGSEGEILRYGFWHAVALGCLMEPLPIMVIIVICLIYVVLGCAMESLSMPRTRDFLQALLKEISGRDWDLKFSLKEGLVAEPREDPSTHVRTQFLRRVAHDIASPTGVTMTVLDELVNAGGLYQKLYEEQTGKELEVRYGESAELAATILEEGENLIKKPFRADQLLSKVRSLLDAAGLPQVPGGLPPHSG